MRETTDILDGSIYIKVPKQAKQNDSLHGIKVRMVVTCGEGVRWVLVML